MATTTKLKLKPGPLEVWSVRERLALACSVRRSGDQNWVSVSRAIKPYGETNRSPEWFSQKNCALQYADLLEKAETPKRKRGEKGEVIETPADQIVRKLTIERIEELKRMVQDEQQKYKKLKKEVESIKAGQMDDKLADMWEQIQVEKKEAEEKQKEEAQKRLQHVQSGGSESLSSLSEADDSTQDSIPEQVNVETMDEDSMTPVTPLQIPPINIEIPPTSMQEQTKPMPPTSPLLSSLLQSKLKSVDGLQQIKAEAEAEHAASQQAAAALAAALAAEVQSQLTESLEGASQPEQSQALPTPALNKLLISTSGGVHTSTLVSPEAKPAPPAVVKIEEVAEEVVQETTDVSENVQVDIEVELPTDESVDVGKDGSATAEVKEESVQSEEEIDPGEHTTSFISIDDEISIKEEPPSPASSVSSRVSETGSKSSTRRKSKGKAKGGRKSQRVTRRSVVEDDKKDETSSRPSDGETSDDDGDTNLGLSAASVLSESIPNSPLSLCSDTEDEKAYKTWKKSIMLVWRAAANHKYANVFLHPVTDDIARGYASVVRRPMDLSTIKKNIEAGAMRTTQEFQRDMMLMFTNAIMYNSSNHTIYKMAVEMYDDVMINIEQYVSTQLMVQSTDTKLLRPTRRNESSDKEDESRRRRTSSEATDGGKSKKRKGHDT